MIGVIEIVRYNFLCGSVVALSFEARLAERCTEKLISAPGFGDRLS